MTTRIKTNKRRVKSRKRVRKDPKKGFLGIQEHKRNGTESRSNIALVIRLHEKGLGEKKS